MKMVEALSSIHNCCYCTSFQSHKSPLYMNVTYLNSFPQIPILKQKEGGKTTQRYIWQIPAQEIIQNRGFPQKRSTSTYFSCAFNHWKDFDWAIMFAFWSNFIFQLRMRPSKVGIVPVVSARSIVGTENFNLCRKVRREQQALHCGVTSVPSASKEAAKGMLGVCETAELLG